MRCTLLLATALAAALPCLAQTASPAAAPTPNPATAATRAANEGQRASLPLADKRSFDDAQRGLIESLGDKVIMRADGARPTWTLRGFEFLAKEDAPDTVHPGLWRHARVNMASGLFKVSERIYQLRGLDLANMTVIEGKTGLIVIDPLLSVETAKAGMELYFKHRPRKPVVALIYSHSHVDHFGGARGVVDEADLAAGKVQVWAPAGFMEEAVSENVMAGNAMSRRALYQFGPLLPRSATGQVDAGLGKSVAFGSITLIPPTRLIEKPSETHSIDGFDIVFELTPGSEAPSEMIMYYPQERVLNMTEVGTQNFHNLLPMRGALVRDPLSWSKYLGGALDRFGARSDTLIAQHHWPVWGGERVQGFLSNQRDAYKYVHDQTLRLMNHGYVGAEIADMIELPASLNLDWSVHSFYGSLKHNIKAIYQRYLGYYDGNPANLDSLPPMQAARKAVEYMGGAEAALKKAREDYARGEYRWVAQLASQLVFADPANQAARQLAADAYEQLGYQAESATARNAYLQGASELRLGVPKVPAVNTAAPDVVRAMPLELFFDYLGVRLNADKAAGKAMTLNWRFTDTKQDFVVRLRNSTLTASAGQQAANADATLVLSRATLDEITLQKLTFPAALQAGRIQVQGKVALLAELLAMFDNFPAMFPIVEPRPAR
ncbi:alkyl sulfatase dimerization domain-containing protein [Pelomonas sp. SE-A7]|uniref:alkyl/aryl-sulfatase n=1 Tax=Pelomonas sp. SE-A7 TaxID=3054953 RepID=UPI00259D05D2|nr:alkyl sulfatase dimerization domain-containing protein [Pelomonas sp. SE-A7]MDM4765050.1 alkyl sulfatase dimerization domain-containing protein [Pelomonas sp. SE-A7]